MGNGLCENMNKTVKNLLKQVVSERPQDWSRCITPVMFAVRDTPQDSTGFTPFELLFGHRVRTPMTLLKHLWTGEKEDPEVKTAYRYVIDLRERIDETCQLAQEEIGKVQKRNQTYYNRRARERRLNVGDNVLWLLPTENNKLTLAWRGSYEVVEKIGQVDYKIRVTHDKIKTYHINMLKKYRQRKEQRIKNDDESGNISELEVSKDGHRIEQVAAIAFVIDDGINKNSEFVIEDDKELLLLYTVKQKESVNDVLINPNLSSEQQDEVRSLLRGYKEILSDVPKVTNIIEHKVELTQREPIRYKAYPTPYKMQEIVNKEIDDLLEMGATERSKPPYASPLVLVKKADNTYRVCVNFKELNKITVFDPEPMTSPDNLFPRLAGSKIYSSFGRLKRRFSTNIPGMADRLRRCQLSSPVSVINF